MKQSRSRLSNAGRSDSGQTTVEYVLVLFIAVVLAMLVLRDLVRPAMQKFSDYISQVVERSLFDKANFHRYRR